METDFFRNTLPQDLEAIAAIASMGVLEPVSGLAGIAGALLPGPTGQGTDWIKNVQDQAYQPNNPETLQSIGSALQVPLEAYEKGTQWLGDTAMDLTGSPAAASIAKTLPEIIGSGFALKQLAKNLPTKAGKDTFGVDEPDLSRRKFLKNAGVMGAATAVPGIIGKGLLDAPGGAAAAAKTISKVPIPKLSHFDYYNVNLLKVLAPEKSGPRFDKFLDRMESGDFSPHEKSYFKDNNLSPLSIEQAVVQARKGKVHLDPEQTSFGASINDRDPVTGIPHNAPEPDGSRMLDQFTDSSDTMSAADLDYQIRNSFDAGRANADNIKKDLRHLLEEGPDGSVADFVELSPDARQWAEKLIEMDDPLAEVYQSAIRQDIIDAGGL